jgi:DNA-binding CsgD family transcriptional regulator
MRPSVSRAREAIEGVCAREHDSRTLRAETVGILQRAIGGSFHAFVLTDPATSVGTDPHAVIPEMRLLPATIRAKYLTTVNRWTSLEPAGLLGAHREESLLWTEALRGHGIVDVASLVLRDAHGWWGFLDLWSDQPYEDTALDLLRSVAPSLTRGLREALAGTLLVGAPVAGGPAVLVMDDELNVLGHTAASEERLGLLLPGPGRPIPAAAYNVAAQLLAREAGVDDHEPSGRVHLDGGRWVTLRASRLDPGDTIAVTIEPTTAAERLDLVARSSALSPRETEILGHLARGEETASVAAAMSLSSFTVQDHLKSIFAKTGVRSRRELVARVLGVAPAGTAES